MSDHIDGPRQIGDPSADLTDVFAFTSPENPARTVLAANVFPTCGVEAVFSNAISHSIVVRPARVAGLGDATRFETSPPEIRFSFRFDALERGANQKPVQRGTCILPDGRTLRFVANEENGSSTSEGTFRVFAGLRSDPFILAWLFRGNTITPVPNLLEHDNVLCIVVEFDTRRVLIPERGSLFGMIAETTPLPRAGGLIGNPPPRFDWVGRPEQTNMRLDNPGLAGADDLRDLWNQQTPFAIGDELRPLFLQRLKDSLANWDMRDGKADWTPPSALAANANMFLDDFLLFDVTKPITDTSYLEIEKSTLNGKAYGTGGGRTVDADVIDGLLSWLVNRDREPLRSGTTRATKPGTKNFPYFATPNTELQSVTDRIDLNAVPDKVWALIGDFGGSWHPLIANIKLIGTGIGQLRVIETIDGKQIVERLEAIDNSAKFYRYTSVSGIPASDYTGTLEVKPTGAGSSVEWSAQYLPKGQGDIVVRTIVSTLFKTGLESLKSRF